MINTDTKGLILNFTGNGKGKTSAALGITLRALGWNWQAGFIQFIKSERETGERRFFAKYFPDMLFKQVGLGFTCVPARDHAGAAQNGWHAVAKLLQNFTGRLLVLDELNIAIHQGFIDAGDVIAALQNRRAGLNVIITGRYAKPELLAICDLVSEIAPVKHHFEQGIPAVTGLDL